MNSVIIVTAFIIIIILVLSVYLLRRITTNRKITQREIEHERVLTDAKASSKRALGITDKAMKLSIDIHNIHAANHLIKSIRELLNND